MASTIDKDGNSNVDESEFAFVVKTGDEPVVFEANRIFVVILDRNTAMIKKKLPVAGGE